MEKERSVLILLCLILGVAVVDDHVHPCESVGVGLLLLPVDGEHCRRLIPYLQEE